MTKISALLAAFALAGPACAQDALEAAMNCPPGSTLVATGSHHSPSCVGSSIPGLVRDVLPRPGAGRPGPDPIFPMRGRLPVADGPRLPAAIGHIAATATDLSAPPSADPSVSNKLAADWSFLFEGGRVPPGARVSWMGGFLSRSNLGALGFSTSYGSDRFEGSIERYRHDLPGFLSKAGPATASLFAQRYGPASPR